jgi:hypothetical protein
MFYMPPVATIRGNRIVEDFANRLRSSGKHRKQIVGAVMPRLFVLAYSVLTSERPFDPEHRVWATYGHPKRPPGEWSAPTSGFF